MKKYLSNILVFSFGIAVPFIASSAATPQKLSSVNSNLLFYSLLAVGVHQDGPTKTKRYRLRIWTVFLNLMHVLFVLLKIR